MTQYTPFGGYRAGSGPNGVTDRGFTGHKQNDDLGLIYMNARYYVSGIARFASADTIVPDPANPQSFNRYSYGLNNPVKYTDPTGHCGADLNEDGSVNQDLFDQCVAIRDNLENTYDISITGEWLFEEMGLLRDAVQRIADVFEAEGIISPIETFKEVWGGVKLNRIRKYDDVGRAWTRSRNRIDFYNGTFQDKTTWLDGSIDHPIRDAVNVYETFAHELGHVWDRRTGRDLSEGLRDTVGGRYEHNFLFFHWGEYTVNDLSPYDGSPNPPNHGEDWAYTFAAFIVDQNGLSSLNRNDLRSPYISQQIQQLDK